MTKMRVLIKFIFGLCASIFLLYSCSQKEKKSKSVFSESEIEKKLNGTVFIGEEFLQDPWTLNVMDSFLILGNFKGLPVIEVYKCSSGEQICSFLTKGQGPLDILAISQFRNNDNQLFISDLLYKKILVVDKSCFNEDSIIIRPFFSINNYDEKIIEVVTKISYFNDKYIIANTTSNEGRLGLLHRDDKTLSYFYPFTESDVLFPELDSYRNNDLFSFDMTIGPKNDRIATSTHNADILDIYEFKDDKMIPVWHHQTFLPNGIKILTFENTPPQAFITNKTVQGYKDITSSCNNVYALFSGISEEEGDISYANRIRVFDWNGENRFEILTDYPIKRIAVDHDDRFLYGISHDKEISPVIIRFDLKELR
jgi:hypothetical protein